MKMVRCLILAAAILGLAGPSHAQMRCNKPYAPVINPAAKISMQEMAAMRSDVTAFVSAIDLYQACLVRRPPSPQNELLLRASQEEKVRVGATFNAYVRAFKASSPS